MTRSTWLLVLVAACGGHGTHPAPPGGGSAGSAAAGGDGAATPGQAPVRPAPAGMAEADLVTLDHGRVTTWSLAGDKPAELGRLQLLDDNADEMSGGLRGDWADRDHLFVWIEPRTVLAITADGVTEVAVPDVSELTAPRPDGEDIEEGGVVGASTGLVVADGAAWWSECPWGMPFDGWQCEGWVSVRLWPSPERKAGDAIAARRWPWPKDEPRGFRLKELHDGHALGCTPPPGTRQRQHVFDADEDEGESIAARHWVSADPPRLLVVYGQPGYDDLVPNRWTLHDGCLPDARAQGTAVEPGPAGLWLASESPDPTADEPTVQLVVRRGAAVLGQLPDGADVRFRPAR